MERGRVGLKGISKRLVFSYIFIIFITIVIFEVLFASSIRNYYYGTVEQTLHDTVKFSSDYYNKYLYYSPIKDKVSKISEEFSEEKYDKNEVQIIDNAGNILASSTGFTSDKKTYTSDVKAALKGNIEVSKGVIELTGEEIMSASAPLEYNDEVVGVIRIMTSIEEVVKVVNGLHIKGIFLGLAVLFIVFIISLIISRSIVYPIKMLTRASTKMANGNFEVRVDKLYNDEIGELADTLNRMADEIVKSENIKNDFISSISHEIRTPLTSIKGWSETMLLGDLEDKEETTVGLEIISKETNRLIGLVEELLDFSKFQSGRISIIEEDVNIKGLAKDIISQFEKRTEDRNLVFECEIQDTMILGDNNRLRQVFINMIDNAYKFTKDGGTIKVNLKKDDKHVIVSIEDDGEGINEEDVEMVLDKFYKGKSKKSGSGLGLAISNEIVKLHGGKIKVTSEYGKGTKLDVYLPADDRKKKVEA